MLRHLCVTCPKYTHSLFYTKTGEVNTWWSYSTLPPAPTTETSDQSRHSFPLSMGMVSGSFCV